MSCLNLTGRFVVLEAVYSGDGEPLRFAIDLSEPFTLDRDSFFLYSWSGMSRSVPSRSVPILPRDSLALWVELEITHIQIAISEAQCLDALQLILT